MVFQWDMSLSNERWIYHHNDWLHILITVRNGYSVVPIALADGLNIKLNTAVQSVRYMADKVELDVFNPRANNREIKTLSGKI